MTSLSRPPNGLGNLSRRLERFLLRTVQENTARRYTSLLGSFRCELERRKIAWADLDEEHRDIVLAEYILECHDADLCSLQECNCLVAALQKIMPRHRYRIAWKTLQAWRCDVPVKQAPAAPPEFAWSFAVLCVAMGQPTVGTLGLACFKALFRISEPLRFRRADVLVSTTAVVFLLGRSKRGLEEQVVVQDPLFTRWMVAYLSHVFRGKPVDRLFSLGYAKVSYWLRKICASLGLGEVGFTTHSWRRGGATELVQLGWTVENICVQGRWACVPNCRLYLRRGDVFMQRLRSDLSSDVWARMESLARIGPWVWSNSTKVQ